MKYVYLGSTGLKVSKIVLGTLDFGTNISKEDSFKIMDKAVELGINFFDTANSYGNDRGENPKFGISESVIGEWFEKNPEKRKQIILNTKCFMKLQDPSYGVNDEDGISAYKLRQQLEDSLSRLKTDHVEIYTMHRCTNNTNWKEIWDTYEYFFSTGKVYYAGASNFSAYTIARCQEEARKRNLLGLVSEQNRYNLCCRQIEVEMTETLHQENISLLTWSPLYGGRLTSKLFSNPTTGRQIRHKPNQELMDKLITFSKLCNEYGFTEEEVAMTWLLNNKNVGCVLMGISSIKEMEDTIRCLDLVLPEELRIKIEKLFPGYPTALDWYFI